LKSAVRSAMVVFSLWCDGSLVVSLLYRSVLWAFLSWILVYGNYWVWIGMESWMSTYDDVLACCESCPLHVDPSKYKNSAFTYVP
jgi:hypothetical protein